MPREHPVITQLRKDIASDEAHLPSLDELITAAQDNLRDLNAQRTAIVVRRDHNKELIARFAPKQVRAKKMAKQQPNTIGDQIAQTALADRREG